MSKQIPLARPTLYRLPHLHPLLTHLDGSDPRPLTLCHWPHPSHYGAPWSLSSSLEFPGVCCCLVFVVVVVYLVCFGGFGGLFVFFLIIQYFLAAFGMAKLGQRLSECITRILETGAGTSGLWDLPCCLKSGFQFCFISQLVCLDVDLQEINWTSLSPGSKEEMSGCCPCLQAHTNHCFLHRFCWCWFCRAVCGFFRHVNANAL